MVRISKQAERRNKRPHRTRAPSPKTGAKKDNLAAGFKEHTNALEAGSSMTFIAKVR